MNLRYDFNRLTFVVDTRSTIGLENKGGSIALHKLAYELAIQDNYVYVFNEPKYPHANIKVINTEIIDSIEDGWVNTFRWESFNFNVNRTVSIYPNITPGNPFNTSHVVRWILHDYSDETWQTFDPNDLICNFGEFKVPDGTLQSTLTVFDFQLDKFTNMDLPSRKGFAHIIHKNTPDWGVEFLKNFGSAEIPHYNGKQSIEYLNLEFNKYEYVLTFDDKSYYTSLAALCGAKSIILNPNKSISPTEYRLANPIQLCGVAYGFDDIAWANQTIGLVRDNLTDLQNKCTQSVYKFIEHWKNKLH